MFGFTDYYTRRCNLHFRYHNHRVQFEEVGHPLYKPKLKFSINMTDEFYMVYNMHHYLTNIIRNQ